MSMIEMRPGWPTIDDVLAAHRAGLVILAVCGTRTSRHPPGAHIQIDHQWRTTEIVGQTRPWWGFLHGALAEAVGCVPGALDWSWQVYPDPAIDAPTNLCVCGHNRWVHALTGPAAHCSPRCGCTEFRMAAP